MCGVKGHGTPCWEYVRHVLESGRVASDVENIVS